MYIKRDKVRIKRIVLDLHVIPSSLIIHVNISLCDTTYCTTSFYFAQLTMDDGSSGIIIIIIITIMIMIMIMIMSMTMIMIILIIIKITLKIIIVICF